MKRIVSLTLFFLQISLALYFGIGQTSKMITSVEGLSPTMFSAFLLSMLINLYLSIKAKNPETGKRDWLVVGIYLTWVIVMTRILFCYFLYGTTSSIDQENEITMLIVISTGSIVLALYGYYKGMKLSDAYIRGGVSAIFKSFPQIMLIPIAYNKGIAGWNEGTIWVGHVTIAIRVTMLLLSIKKKGATKEDYAILISELANSLSWIAFTIIYYTLK